MALAQSGASSNTWAENSSSENSCSCSDSSSSSEILPDETELTLAFFLFSSWDALDECLRKRLTDPSSVFEGTSS